jgi:hypothetical protein
MNNLLYNISLLILGLGIILMIVYISRVTGGKRINIVPSDIQNDFVDVFNERPSQRFKKMFEQPPIWTGYEDWDPKNKVPQQKLYSNPVPKFQFNI